MSANTETPNESDEGEQQRSDHDQRDLVDELDGSAGEVGVPVDAVCTNCRITPFKHVCHNCQRGTWWNVRRVLVDLDEWGSK